MNTTLKTLVPLAIVFSLLVATNFLYAAWNAPSGTPSSGNNVATPINVGNTDQVKTGGLSVDALSVVGDAYVQGNMVGTPSGNVTLEIEGKTGASEYCDESGLVCFTAAEARTVIDAASQFTIYTKFEKDYFWGGAKWLGRPSRQRVSSARATCDVGDYAIGGRDISFGDEMSWKNTYSQVIDGYNQLSPDHLDASGVEWGTPYQATYHYRKVWNDYARLNRHGSYVGVEVQCLHINN